MTCVRLRAASCRASSVVYAAKGLAVPDELARDVEQRLHGEFSGFGCQRAVLEIETVLAPAQHAGKVCLAAVGGDQCRLVEDLGRQGEPGAAVEPGGEFAEFLHPVGEWPAWRARALDQREPGDDRHGGEDGHDAAPAVRAAAGSGPNTTRAAVLARTAWALCGRPIRFQANTT